MDEEQAIHLGIDNKTIQFNGLNNQLYVDTSFLPKASSNNYGVVKLTNEVSRTNNIVSNKSGISINSNGEIFINDDFLNALQNYIHNEISTAISPLLNTQSNIKLYDGIYYYFPYDLNKTSIQYISKNIIFSNNQNYIGFKNTLEFNSTYSDQLNVTINLEPNNNNLNLYKNGPTNLMSIINYKNDYYGNKIYSHIIKNMLFEFYPNLTNNIIEYNMKIQVNYIDSTTEESSLISDNVFKIIQQPLTTDKNEIFKIDNIVIDIDNKIQQINYIIYDNIYIGENIINNYISNNLIEEISLELNNSINYKLDLNDLTFKLDKNTDIINDIPKINWKIQYKCNNINNILINEGICDVIKNSINILNYEFYYYDNITEWNSLYQTNPLALVNDESIYTNKYKLVIKFADNESYEQFKNIIDNNKFNIIINEYQYINDNKLLSPSISNISDINNKLNVTENDNFKNYSRSFEIELNNELNNNQNNQFHIQDLYFKFNEISKYFGENNINNTIQPYLPSGESLYNLNNTFELTYDTNQWKIQNKNNGEHTDIYKLSDNNTLICYEDNSQIINTQCIYKDSYEEQEIQLFKKNEFNENYYKCIHYNAIKFNEIPVNINSLNDNLNYKDSNDTDIFNYSDSYYTFISNESLTNDYSLNLIDLKSAIQNLIKEDNVYINLLDGVLDIKYYKYNNNIYYGICKKGKDNKSPLTLSNDHDQQRIYKYTNVNNEESTT